MSVLRGVSSLTAVLASVCTPVTWAAAGAVGGATTSARPTPTITAVLTDKSRYAPGEPVQIAIDIDNSTGRTVQGAAIVVQLQDLGRTVNTVRRSVSLPTGKRKHFQLTLMPPLADYHGYRVEVQVVSPQQHPLAIAATAIDVSSDWTHFPRYGYLAHFDVNIPAEQWVSELNRFHINGLQFYDFQYKHHVPAPPPDETMWRDIANRPTAAKTLLSFISAAKKHNMTTMAYNASYAAYGDAFHDGSGVKLEWAAWGDVQSPRTEVTTKSFDLPPGWATRRLIYMNQDDPGWQKYIFSRMRDLLELFPFDGWHIDTYGDAEAFAWNGAPIDYFAGFPKFVDAARAALGRPVVLNTVGGHGQVAMAHSATDFVYSELWPPDHPTYQSIQSAADEIHTANPSKALVFAAYLHRELSDRLRREAGGRAHFDAPAVLLADAVMFSVGASHLELGDGYRMLSNPYFPADTAITPPEDLREQMARYYDFLVAYENYLRDCAIPASFPISLTGAAQTLNGQPGAVWTIARQKGDYSVVHLINLTSLKRAEWRDDALDYPRAPVLHDLKVALQLSDNVSEVGWASPDIDEGRWHELPVNETSSPPSSYEVTVPELRYWTVLIVRRREQKN